MPETGSWKRRRVGLIFDERMCKHKIPGRKEDHPENPERIRAIWDKLNASGIVQRCVVLNAKEAEDNHLALVHSKEHIDLIKTISSKCYKTMRKRAQRFNSMYFNKGSSEAAYLAAGSVIEAAERVARGELDSAFAIVRPPGHHAEESEPMGFCLYNNVAVATSVVLNERPELGISRILIVDWDVHHGNSTQNMFYTDHRVLFFSVHRHDSGRFYPHGDDGSYNMIGEGPGVGYNINVPWENGGCGDADYIAVWDHILIPVAKEFDPDMIIISAGFDAAIGDPLGGCCLSAYGYSIMLDKLMDFARGKIVIALEGGYDPASLANSAQACVEVLLQDKPLIRPLEDLPLESTWPLIQAVRQALCSYWPILAAKLPGKEISSRPLQIEADVRIRQDEVDVQTPSTQASSELEQAHSSVKENNFEDQQGLLADTQDQSNETMLTEEDPEELYKSEEKKYADIISVEKLSNNFDEKCLALESQARKAREMVDHAAELRTAVLEEIDLSSADLLMTLENILKVLRADSIMKDKKLETSDRSRGKWDKNQEKQDKGLEKLEARTQHIVTRLKELPDNINRKSDEKKHKGSDETQRQPRPPTKPQGEVAAKPKRRKF